MVVEIRILRQGDSDLFKRVAEGVFDNDIDDRWLTEFLDDSCHHLAAALEDGIMVGMASAVRYVHPDKSPQLWLNEIGVATSHRSRGIGKRLMSALLEVGRQLGCSEAWVLTDSENAAACRLYKSLEGDLEPSPIMFSFQLSTGHVQPTAAPTSQ